MLRDRRAAKGLLTFALALVLTAACTSATEAPQVGGRDDSPNGGVGTGEVSRDERGPRNWRAAACSLPAEHVERVRRGYYPDRSPDVFMVPRTPNFFGAFSQTSHSGPWDYLQEVPLVFYGPGFVRPAGRVSVDRQVTLADIAPTLAELLGFEFPLSKGKNFGRPIPGVLLPRNLRRGAPKVIVTVIWDGGGWNVLDRWPRSWPHLRTLMHGGASVSDVVAGSSPSVTPAIHATIGTGAFPRRHGIVDIPLRDGDEVSAGSFPGGSPHFLELPTLADVHDRRAGNRAQIGALAYVFFHLGMLGHGAYLPEADRDIAVIPVVERGSVVTKPAVMTTNASFYTLPDWVDEVPGFDDDYRKIDSLDGSLDDRWRGHDLSDPSHARHSPVWALYETRLLLELLDREEFGGDDVPDLFYVNYKQIDDAGHNWNMLNPEMGDTLKYTDLGLRDLVEFLNDTVGKRKWVLALTADHGQAPDPLTIGAWPIKMKVFTGAIAEHFGVEASELFLDHRPVGLWLDRDFAASRGISPSEVADFIIGMRIEGNIREGEEVPQKYDDRMDELLFAAAWPSAQTDAVWRCVTRRGRS